MEKGRQLFTFVLNPVLNIGITLAIFRLSGNIHQTQTTKNINELNAG